MYHEYTHSDITWCICDIVSLNDRCSAHSGIVVLHPPRSLIPLFMNNVYWRVLIAPLLKVMISQRFPLHVPCLFVFLWSIAEGQFRGRKGKRLSTVQCRPESESIHCCSRFNLQSMDAHKCRQLTLAFNLAFGSPLIRTHLDVARVNMALAVE